MRPDKAFEWIFCLGQPSKIYRVLLEFKTIGAIKMINSSERLTQAVKCK